MSSFIIFGLGVLAGEFIILRGQELEQRDKAEQKARVQPLTPTSIGKIPYFDVDQVLADFLSTLDRVDIPKPGATVRHSTRLLSDEEREEAAEAMRRALRRKP